MKKGRGAIITRGSPPHPSGYILFRNKVSRRDELQREPKGEKGKRCSKDICLWEKEVSPINRSRKHLTAGDFGDLQETGMKTSIRHAV